MSILNAAELEKRGPHLVAPFHRDMIQPASIDVHLDRYFKVLRKDGAFTNAVLDVAHNNSEYWDTITNPMAQTFILKPEDFVLASTYERITMPDDLVGRFEGKSSLGRQGLITHVTAGFIDPGFRGTITLELKNVTPYSIALHPGMKIGQICFEELAGAVLYAGTYNTGSYGSHYQNQFGPTLSKSHENFTTIEVLKETNTNG